MNMKVRYSYLEQQFSDCDDLWQELKEFVATGDFTLGAPLQEFEQTKKIRSKTRLNFTIDRTLAGKFRKYCRNKGYNMSAKIENSIRELVEV